MVKQSGSQIIGELFMAILLLIGAFFVFSAIFGFNNGITNTQKKQPDPVQDSLRANLVGNEEAIVLDYDPAPLPKDQRIYPAQRVFNLQNLTPITLEQAKEDLRLFQEYERQKKALLAALDIEDEVQGKYYLQSLEKLGSVNARSFLVGDLDTGEIIFERKAKEIYPIASITKFFTAFTAAEEFSPNEIATIDPKELEVLGSRARFIPGDTLSMRDLLYPLLLVSSNDAGEVIAQQRDRDAFINSMNELVQSFELSDTGFGDPTGLSTQNVSTARDLFSFMQITRNTYPQIVGISQLSEKSINEYTWRNINRASGFPEFRGGKTGFTNAALQTSIGYYEIVLTNGETKNIGVVILQSNTRQQDTRNILDYLKEHVVYEEQEIKNLGN